MLLIELSNLSLSVDVSTVAKELRITFKYTHLFVPIPFDFQRYFYQMSSLVFTHFNAAISVGLAIDRQYYFVEAGAWPVALIREVYKGNLYYRLPCTSIRFSRRRIISAMQKRRLSFSLPNRQASFPILLF